MEQQSINLDQKSVTELKAIAFDLKGIADTYSQNYNIVIQEIQKRVAEEQKAFQGKTPPPPDQNLQGDAKKTSKIQRKPAIQQ